MTMDEPNTRHDWRQLELDVGRLFSGAPFSPAAALDHGPRQELYPGRAAEMRLMMHAVRDPAKHILLYGERSLGKTSLSNTFWRNRSSAGQPVLAARVQAYPSDDFSSLWSRALAEFQTVFRRYSQELRSDFAQVSPDTVRREFQKLPNNLGAIMIIDEFDLLRAREVGELTANLLKSLHDHAINVTVLLIGVAENIEELIINHQSLRRVLTLVKLERMKIIDLNEILDSRLRLTPLRISDDARSEIVSLSCGLPYYVQTLGRFAAQNAVTNQRLQVQTEDVNAAIENFIVECGTSFADDYQRATASQRENNIFHEVIFASAFAPADASGVFKSSEVTNTLNLIDPGRDHHQSRVQQYLTQFTLERRGKILIRSGVKGDYRYRFSDALMQPFIVMRAIKDSMIDEGLWHLLLHSGKAARGDAQSRLGVPDAAQPATIVPTAAEEAGGETAINPVSEQAGPRLAGATLALHPENAGLIRAVRDSNRTATMARRTHEGSRRLLRRWMLLLG